MITIIHGDDTTLSRNYYISEREKHPEKKIIEGNTVTLTDLMQVFSGNGLFGDQETIFIEELVSKRKSPKDMEELVGFLAHQTEAQVFVWESKTLTPKQTNLFGKATVKEFKTPIIVFSFLDSLKPGNSQQMIKLYHDVLSQEDAGYVLAMLTRHVRMLLALFENNRHPVQNDNVTVSSPTISEVTRMAPWQKSKLEKQTELFTQKKLLLMHQQLFDMELGQKTGTLTSPLPDSIDFFLLSI